MVFCMWLCAALCMHCRVSAAYTCRIWPSSPQFHLARCHCEPYCNDRQCVYPTLHTFLYARTLRRKLRLSSKGFRAPSGRACPLMQSWKMWIVGHSLGNAPTWGSGSCGWSPAHWVKGPTGPLLYRGGICEEMQAHAREACRTDEPPAASAQLALTRRRLGSYYHGDAIGSWPRDLLIAAYSLAHRPLCQVS